MIMSRIDGFPTDRELQARFTAGARDVFVAATERELQGKVSEYKPWALGKPLDHLQLVLRKRHNSMRRPEPVRSFQERLFITPLQADSADELFGESKEYIRNYYRQIAEAMASTAITDTLRFGGLSSSMVDAAWSVSHDADVSVRGRISSFMKDPTRQNLVRANGFVEEAVEYARHSSLFDRSDPIRQDEYRMGFTDADPSYVMRHEFHLKISPLLPISGLESQEFIEYYVRAMSKGIDRCEAELVRLVAQNAERDVLDAASEKLDSYVQAKKAAEKHLL